MVDTVICHNTAFDKAVLSAELYRRRRFTTLKLFHDKEFKCTGKLSTPVCKLRTRRAGQYKMPKLSEAYQILVDEKIGLKLHDALNDCILCGKIYEALVSANTLVLKDTLVMKDTLVSAN
jgi:DNA polymerase III epsilon subunit-like protein